jgi:hypothetical protein
MPIPHSKIRTLPPVRSRKSDRLPQRLKYKADDSRPRQESRGLQAGKKIWIDLENSPHVPFFRPIIPELVSRGHRVIVTARDCFQVCELADLYGMKYAAFGHHYGKNKAAKVAGLVIRCGQLAPTIFGEKPDLALSHGSRTLMLLASMLRIPSLTIMDYEHSSKLSLPPPSWWMAPEVIPANAFGSNKQRLLQYKGIKEDVYAPGFEPDPAIREQLGFAPDDLVVTVRPPATEAHYHNSESEALLDAAIELIARHPRGRIVLLPRNGNQDVEYRRRWSGLRASGKLVIPEHVMDGLNLVWFSDLVISGGGTMNREAAALSVPVYSIFRGPMGAVDQYLAKSGRLILLTSVQDVETRIALVPRKRPSAPPRANPECLGSIVDGIEKVLQYSNGSCQ